MAGRRADFIRGRCCDALLDGMVYGLAALAMVLLALPSVIIVAISFGEAAIVQFPPEGFTLRWYQALFEDHQLMDAALHSVWLAAAVTLVTLAFAIPAAYALAQDHRGQSLLLAMMTIPQMMPGIVIGIALLYCAASLGQGPSTFLTVLGLAVFCFPFALRILAARFATIDPLAEKAAGVLGANDLQTLRWILLPQMMSAVFGASALVFIESFDNITVTLFTSSPRARPLAVELYGLVQFDGSPKVAALCSLQIVMALATMSAIMLTTGLEGLWGRRPNRNWSSSVKRPSITSPLRRSAQR